MTLLKGSDDGYVCKFNFKGECILKFQAHRIGTRGIVVFNHELYTASMDTNINRWTIDGKCQQIFQGHSDWVRCVTMWNGVLVSGDDGNTIIQWTGKSCLEQY